MARQGHNQEEDSAITGRHRVGNEMILAVVTGLFEGGALGSAFSWIFHDWSLLLWFGIGFPVQKAIVLLLDNWFGRRRDEDTQGSIYLNRPIPSVTLQWMLYSVFLGIVDNSQTQVWWHIPLYAASGAAVGLLIGYLGKREYERKQA
ncbi:hypothetical protein [uncultured Bifidobacterium sp.]|uniref:hypothetical protein n=1 Tax=uncultured Bifidobacterium sp. TaxID=165187 RepID=UPI0026297518|nr:hypothetical protein [uncultured Bifidobacterium sp.]